MGKVDVGNPSEIVAERCHINVLQNIINLVRGRGATTISGKKRFSAITNSNEST